MQRRGRIFRFLLGGLIIFSLFGIMRGGAYRSGYSRGYYEGQSVTQQQAESAIPESGAETAVPEGNSFRNGPVYGHGYEYGHHHYGFFGFFGGLFKFLFTLMLIGFFFKMVAFGFWNRRGWKGHKGWHRGHHRWHRHDGDGYEKSPEDVDPDVKTL